MVPVTYLSNGSVPNMNGCSFLLNPSDRVNQDYGRVSVQHTWTDIHRKTAYRTR